MVFVEEGVAPRQQETDQTHYDVVDEGEAIDADDDAEDESADANNQSEASFSSESSSSSSSSSSTASASQPLKKRRVDSVPEPPPPPPPAAAAEWPVSAEAKGSGSNQAGPRRAANELDYLIFKHQRIQKLLRKGTNEIKSSTTFCECHADCTRTRSLQKFGGLDAVRIMLKQWLLAPHYTFCSENGTLGTKESHMEF